MDPGLRQFLTAKARNLMYRARRLTRLDQHSLGIRPEDRPFVPSDAHFVAANRRLSDIDRDVRAALSAMSSAMARPDSSAQQILAQCALVERQVDRARRAYGLFFEVFSQRGTAFARPLSACDTVAADCFAVVRKNAPGLLQMPLLKPVTYLEHSFSPATFRRGVLLSRLLGEQNPFPLVRIPYERIEAPWGMGVLLHEVGHNLQSDLGVWHETRLALQRRVLLISRNAWLTRIWSRWHREIFADLCALLLGGPASARAMKDFLAYPAARVLSFRPLGVHPTPYLRIFILAEMLRRMGFADDARVLRAVWNDLYLPHVSTARVPQGLLITAERLIPHVVDEVAFQPRRGLAQRALADIIPFAKEDERRIHQGARELAQGRVPSALPPRFVVSASRVAFEQKWAPPGVIAKTVVRHLTRQLLPPAPRTAHAAIPLSA